MTFSMTTGKLPHNRSIEKDMYYQYFRSVFLLALMAIFFCGTSAMGDDSGRITLTEENDSIIFPTDWYYTQGLELSYLSGNVVTDSAWLIPFSGLSAIGLFGDTRVGGDASRRYRIILGQSIFTPNDTSAVNPDRDDRPYAGWTYGGIGFVQDTGRRQFDNIELLVGIVGPGAQGRLAQNDWHQFIGIDGANGWDYQIHNEPGVMLTYERKYRFIQPLLDGFAIEAVPEAGATIGNVMTYAQVSMLLRFGCNLEADYGPNSIRPALSGTNYFNDAYLEGPFGFYTYVGAQGRAVARNIFLDGNTFRDSRDVDKEVFVGDIVGGIAMFWSSAIKLDAGFTYRTQDFEGQDDAAKFANINLSFGF
jgi:hypothetical protein